jgi:hypothetical protein
MHILKTEPREARAQSVSVSEDTLTVDLQDGRTVAVPIAWYPRLSHGSGEERGNWRLIGDGLGIHWPDLDEDISIEGLLLGYPSNENPKSIQRWLDGRAAQRTGS